MFDRLIESGGARPHPSLSALCFSVVANAMFAYGAATATRAPDAAAPDPDAGATREAVYLIPPPPQRVPFEEVGVQWAGGDGPGALSAPLDAASQLAVETGGDDGRGRGRRGGRRKTPGETADSIRLAGELAGGTVYVAAELDKPVAFDPTSAAPAYPPDLQQAGIEGSATMRFVVDTIGTADSTTVEVLAMTHPGFAAAVREALPRMRFRPAELGELRVRQLVEQQFKFKLAMPPVAGDSADAAAPPPGEAAGTDTAAAASTPAARR
ncbi:MAG: hypothetical protein AVDCRST_MAG11-901 [uncultured Gemmatimonadaceae bacterium]|uniref:TonB C-terminal domain-containing protein n=1 Tax=uncultured Gemmatimonadaceae bacterium TaxID=246130 RepID=A0A6J4KCM6_9BACT|nr:MAG: hypothetical protein AVDCRST_MAG11-901 [uncultured Gemmatimonadaceae bacterium]